MTWEDYSVEMSQFDLGEYDTIFQSINNTNQIDMVCCDRISVKYSH